VIAEHSVALLAVVRAMADSAGASETPEPPSTPDGPPDEPPPAGPGRYQHIPVTVEE
jgi:hypothetical protein